MLCITLGNNDGIVKQKEARVPIWWACVVRTAINNSIRYGKDGRPKGYGNKEAKSKYHHIVPI